MSNRTTTVRSGSRDTSTSEDMFCELGELGADSPRDPAVRAAISTRYDSVR